MLRFMKFYVKLLGCCLLLLTTTWAQNATSGVPLVVTTNSASPVEDPAAAIRREHIFFGVESGTGMGLFDRTNVRYARAGVRLGAVMTGEMGSGFLRGTFEEDVAFMPVDYILWNGYRSVYGFSVSPVNLKWNFTTPRRTIPYIVATGSIQRTDVKVPPPNTSKVNFTEGVGIGFNHFLRPGRSVSFEFRANHFSNASLGDHNPGINSSLQFTLGYNWWKH
jgi:hypothetical protein